MLKQMYPSRKDVLNDEGVNTGTEMAERKKTPEEIRNIISEILKELGGSTTDRPADYSEGKQFGPEKMTEEEMERISEGPKQTPTDQILKLLNREQVKLGSPNRKPYSEEYTEKDIGTPIREEIPTSGIGPFSDSELYKDALTSPELYKLAKLYEKGQVPIEIQKALIKEENEDYTSAVRPGEITKKPSFLDNIKNAGKKLYRNITDSENEEIEQLKKEIDRAAYIGAAIGATENDSKGIGPFSPFNKNYSRYEDYLSLNPFKNSNLESLMKKKKNQ